MAAPPDAEAPRFERVEGIPSPLFALDARRYAQWHAAVIVALVALCLAGQYVSLQLHHDRAMGFVGDFDLDEEGNFPTWFQSAMLLAAAGLLELVGRARRRMASVLEAPRWRLLAVGFLLMSIDEVVAFHERFTLPIEMIRNVPAFAAFSWVVPGALLVACVAAYFLPWAKSLPRRTRRLLGIAGATYVIGAVGFEAIGGIQAIFAGLHNWGYIASYVVEETLEMAGVLVLNFALIDLLQNGDAAALTFVGPPAA